MSRPELEPEAEPEMDLCAIRVFLAAVIKKQASGQCRLQAKAAEEKGEFFAQRSTLTPVVNCTLNDRHNDFERPIVHKIPTSYRMPRINIASTDATTRWCTAPSSCHAE